MFNLVLFLAAPLPLFAQKAAAAIPASCAVMEDVIQLYEADRRNLVNFYDLPWSQARFERMDQLYREWQARLGQTDFDNLNQAGRIDYLLLRNKLRAELSHLTLAGRQLAEMEALLAFRKPMQDLEQARWRMEQMDPQASATTVATLVEQVKKLRERIEKGKKQPEKEKAKETKSPGETSSESKADSAKEKPDVKVDEVQPLKITPLLAKRTAAAVNEVRGTLKNWFTFYDGYQPDFSWWVKKPYDEAMTALEGYAKYLREEVAELKGKEEDPLLGEPIGAETLGEQISIEMLPYSAEELIAIGEKEFAWCEAEMKKAAQEMGFSEDWKAALTKVKKMFVPPGKQDTLIAEQARAAIKFVKDHNLVTVPPLCEETWRLTMISSDGQKTMPYAAYSGLNIMVAYAKDDMKHEDKLMAMRGNNRHFARITTAHELVPGHHLQFFNSARYNTHRSMFSTPFLVEGWALYWELRLWELNYAQSPEDRIGMLFWRMHRSARIIVSLKFHLGQMKPKEMVDFLIERVGHEKFGATSEVRRFIGGDYSPLYQCGYMIGGMQLRALRKEIVDAGKMTDKQFNDTVLTYNAIPVELIRAGLLNIPLTRDTRSSWKFAN